MLIKELTVSMWDALMEAQKYAEKAMMYHSACPKAYELYKGFAKEHHSMSVKFHKLALEKAEMMPKMHEGYSHWLEEYWNCEMRKYTEALMRIEMLVAKLT